MLPLHDFTFIEDLGQWLCARTGHAFNRFCILDYKMIILKLQEKEYDAKSL